jgi:hypothetical protein
MAELNELYDKLFPSKVVAQFCQSRVAQNVYVKYYVTIQFVASGAWASAVAYLSCDRRARPSPSHTPLARTLGPLGHVWISKHALTKCEFHAS